MLDKNKLIAFLFTMLSMSMASEENSLLAELQGIEKKFISECNADKFEITAIAQALNKCNIEVKKVLKFESIGEMSGREILNALPCLENELKNQKRKYAILLSLRKYGKKYIEYEHLRSNFEHRQTEAETDSFSEQSSEEKYTESSFDENHCWGDPNGTFFCDEEKSRQLPTSNSKKKPLTCKGTYSWDEQLGDWTCN